MRLILKRTLTVAEPLPSQSARVAKWENEVLLASQGLGVGSAAYALLSARTAGRPRPHRLHSRLDQLEASGQPQAVEVSGELCGLAAALRLQQIVFKVYAGLLWTAPGRCVAEPAPQ